VDDVTLSATAGVHTQHEDVPWDQNIADHPPRMDSPEYRASRDRLHSLVAASAPQFLPYSGPGGYQDHHGGGVWAWTGDDPEAGEAFFVLLPVGIEWSAQFACSPAKVDNLRLIAAAFYGGFPKSAAALGLGPLLAAPIVDQEGIATWVDGLCNASVPMHAGSHTGTLTSRAAPYAGYHHYPKPIGDVQFVVRDDFDLWVQTPQGEVAVVPAGPIGGGDRAVALLWVPPGHPLEAAMVKAHAHGARALLPAEHPIARLAFQEAAGPVPTSEVMS
jgi:hypothetical protein